MNTADMDFEARLIKAMQELHDVSRNFYKPVVFKYCNFLRENEWYTFDNTYYLGWKAMFYVHAYYSLDNAVDWAIKEALSKIKVTINNSGKTEIKTKQGCSIAFMEGMSIAINSGVFSKDIEYMRERIWRSFNMPINILPYTDQVF